MVCQGGQGIPDADAGAVVEVAGAAVQTAAAAVAWPGVRTQAAEAEPAAEVEEAEAGAVCAGRSAAAEVAAESAPEAAGTAAAAAALAETPPRRPAAPAVTEV